MKEYSKEDIDKFNLALRMAGVDLHPGICETMLLVKDEWDKKGEEFSLRDSCEIMSIIQEKYPNGQFYQQIQIGRNFKL